MARRARAWPGWRSRPLVRERRPMPATGAKTQRQAGPVTSLPAVTRRLRGQPRDATPSPSASDAERLPLAEPLAASPAPDRDPAVAVDLPRAVSPDDSRVLVDPEHDRRPRRLQRDERDQRLGPRVVVRQDRDAVHESETLRPPDGKRERDLDPWQQPELHAAPDERHRPCRAS